MILCIENSLCLHAKTYFTFMHIVQYSKLFKIFHCVEWIQYLE